MPIPAGVSGTIVERALRHLYAEHVRLRRRNVERSQEEVDSRKAQAPVDKLSPHEIERYERRTSARGPPTKERVEHLRNHDATMSSLSASPTGKRRFDSSHLETRNKLELRTHENLN